MKEQHLGSDFDEHLEEEGLLEETEAVAAKRVFAYQVAQAMEEQGLSKSAMARRMGTSRSSLDRLLDPEVPSVTLTTLQKAARALGKRVQVEMVDPPADEKTTTDRKREPMGQEGWERFKTRLTNRLIERHYAPYLQHEDNPIHALLAYRALALPRWRFLTGFSACWTSGQRSCPWSSQEARTSLPPPWD